MAEKPSKFGLIAIHLVSIACFCLVSCQMIGTRKYFKRVYYTFMKNPKWSPFGLKKRLEFRLENRLGEYEGKLKKDHCMFLANR